MIALLTLAVAFADPALPTIPVETLAGQDLVLPRDLRTDTTIAFVSFSRDHQDHMDTWLPLARELSAAADVDWIAVPVMGEVGGLTRFFIKSGMKGGIKEDAFRERMALAWVERPPVIASLGLLGEDDLMVAVVDRDGSVRVSFTGPMTPDGADGLRAAVQPAP